MTRRFYCARPIEGHSAVLQDSEAHHLARVLRGRPGEQVVLFDGSGREYRAEVETVARHEVQLRVLSSQTIDRELPLQLVLAVALPRGERQEWLAQKAVELGVTALVPLRTQRGVAIPSRQTQHRLRRTVIEASKQCGRNRLMEIRAATPLDDLVTGLLGISATPGTSGQHEPSCGRGAGADRRLAARRDLRRRGTGRRFYGRRTAAGPRRWLAASRFGHPTTPHRDRRPGIGCPLGIGLVRWANPSEEVTSQLAMLPGSGVLAIGDHHACVECP